MTTASPGYTLLCTAVLLLVSGLFNQTAPAQSDDDAATPETDIAVTAFGTVDMAVQDADLVQVLEMLSIQSQKNIIAGRDVSATVTASFPAYSCMRPIR